MSTPNSISPPMLGDIKTGTPLEITFDTSLIDNVTGQVIQNVEEPSSLKTDDMLNLENKDAMDIDYSIPSDTIKMFEEARDDIVMKDSGNGTPDQNPNPEEEGDEDDPIQKMRRMHILPDLFNMIHDLLRGKILAKDFDNTAGSLRLKLATLKKYMQEVEGIGETLQNTQLKIENLKQNNEMKYSLLKQFKLKVNLELEDDQNNDLH